MQYTLSIIVSNLCPSWVTGAPEESKCIHFVRVVVVSPRRPTKKRQCHCNLHLTDI